MKNIKFILKFCFILALVFFSRNVYAEGNVNLEIKNNGTEILSTSVALPDKGTADINDSDGNPHSVDARSVLDIVSLADTANSAFSISNLVYYPSFSAFYLKCINAGGSNLCDNWQYKVNDADPGVGMDQDVLTGGENVVLFFGDDNPEPPAPPPPAPEEPQPVSRSSSGSSGGSVVQSSALVVKEVPVPAPELAPEPAPIEVPPPVVPSVQPTPPQIEPPAPLAVNQTETKVAVKKITQHPPAIKNLASENVATVVAAEPAPPAITPPAPKESWIRTLLRWLFGF